MSEIDAEKISNRIPSGCSQPDWEYYIEAKGGVVGKRKAYMRGGGSRHGEGFPG